MKNVAFALLLSFLCLSVNAQTQTNSNQTICEKYEYTDKKLNVYYRTILSMYADNHEFIKSFKNSQIAWLKFRDTHIEALYPTVNNEDKNFTYGSAYSNCYCDIITGLTEVRNKQLKVWIDGIREGDVCSGSVRSK